MAHLQASGNGQLKTISILLLFHLRDHKIKVDDEEPEWMSTEDLEITPPGSCEVIEKDYVLLVFTLLRLSNAVGIIFKTTWETFLDLTKHKEQRI